MRNKWALLEQIIIMNSRAWWKKHHTCLVGGWTNPWKIDSSNWVHLPQASGWKYKITWKYQPDIMNELKNELGKKMNNKYLIFNPGEVGSPQKLDIPTSFAYIYIYKHYNFHGDPKIRGLLSPMTTSNHNKSWVPGGDYAAGGWPKRWFTLHDSSWWQATRATFPGGSGIKMKPIGSMGLILYLPRFA